MFYIFCLPNSLKMYVIIAFQNFMFFFCFTMNDFLHITTLFLLAVSFIHTKLLTWLLLFFFSSIHASVKSCKSSVIFLKVTFKFQISRSDCQYKLPFCVYLKHSRCSQILTKWFLEFVCKITFLYRMNMRMIIITIVITGLCVVERLSSSIHICCLDSLS